MTNTLILSVSLTFGILLNFPQSKFTQLYEKNNDTWQLKSLEFCEGQVR